MRIIITRHGETEGNKRLILQGDLPGTLSQLGKLQAEKLAEKLKDEKIELIVSSNLARAVDTAKEVLKFHEGVDFVLDERFRERGFGRFEGMTHEELGIPRGVKAFEFLKGKGIETNEEIFERVDSLLDDFLNRDEECILFVGHMGVCKFFISRLLKKDLKDLKDVRIQNASISIFKIEDGVANEILLNSVEHLK